MAETPNDKPKNPNIQRPAQPSNNKASEQKLDKLAVGIGELNKTLKEILGNDKDNTKTEEARFQGEEKEDRLKALMMRKNLIGVKKSVDKNTEEITKTIKDSTKKTAEETKEGKDENKKFLSKLTEMFDGIKKGLSGATSGINLKPLLAVWTFFKKMGKLALLLGVGGILANVKIEDVKKIWQGIKDLFEKTYKFLAPIVAKMKEYFAKTLIPTMVVTLLSVMDSIGLLIDDLTKDFKGWENKSKWEKFFSLTGALTSIGQYVIRFAEHITDAVFNLIGYDGSITKDIKGHFTNIFGPNFSLAVFEILGFIVGAMTIANIFGVGKKKLITMIGTVFLAPLWGLIKWLGLWAWYLTGGVISVMTGVLVGIPLLVTGLAVYYNGEIARGLSTALDSVTHWFANLPVKVNNMIAATDIGKALGFMKQGEVETTDTSDFYYAARDRRAKAIKTLNDLEARFASRKGGPQGGGGVEWTDADHTKLGRARNELKEANFQWKNHQVFAPIVIEKMKSKSDITLSKSPPANNFFDPNAPDFVAKLKSREKFMPESYKDRETRSIGYGFNLNKPNAQKLLDDAGIKATVQELKNKTKSISEEQASTLMLLESGYFKQQAIDFTGPGLWSTLSKEQKGGLHDMTYQTGSLAKWDLLKAALLNGDSAAIQYEIMKNSELAKQTPGRAQEQATAIARFNNVPNQSGSGLGANEPHRGAMGSPMIVTQDNSQHNNGDNVTLGSGGSAHPNRDIVSQQKYSLKTS